MRARAGGRARDGARSRRRQRGSRAKATPPPPPARRPPPPPAGRRRAQRTQRPGGPAALVCGGRVRVEGSFRAVLECAEHTCPLPQPVSPDPAPHSRLWNRPRPRSSGRQRVSRYSACVGPVSGGLGRAIIPARRGWGGPGRAAASFRWIGRPVVRAAGRIHWQAAGQNGLIFGRQVFEPQFPLVPCTELPTHPSGLTEPRHLKDRGRRSCPRSPCPRLYNVTSQLDDQTGSVACCAPKIAQAGGTRSSARRNVRSSARPAVCRPLPQEIVAPQPPVLDSGGAGPHANSLFL